MEPTIWKLAISTALFAQEAGGGGGGEAAPAGNLFYMLLPFLVLAGIIAFLVHLYRRGLRSIEQDILRPPRQKPQSRSSAPSWMFPAG